MKSWVYAPLRTDYIYEKMRVYAPLWIDYMKGWEYMYPCGSIIWKDESIYTPVDRSDRRRLSDLYELDTPEEIEKYQEKYETSSILQVGVYDGVQWF